MRIILSRELGYCSGVRHAVMETERMLQGKASVVAADTLLHNTREMKRLTSLGLQMITQVSDKALHSAIVLLPAHGSTASERAARLSQAMTLVDLTCPIVEHARAAVTELAMQHVPIMIVGDREHRETRYLVEAAGTALLAVISSAKDLALLVPPPRVGIVYQTTQSRQLRQAVLEWCRVAGSEVLERQTLCPEVLRRQDSTVLLAQKCTIMLVLGDRSSANTCRLVSVAAAACKRSYLVADPAEIHDITMRSADLVGIVSGTSCPQSFIDGVLDWLKRRYSSIQIEMTS